jgi:hypothetical protein
VRKAIQDYLPFASMSPQANANTEKYQTEITKRRLNADLTEIPSLLSQWTDEWWASFQNQPQWKGLDKIAAAMEDELASGK